MTWQPWEPLPDFPLQSAFRFPLARADWLREAGLWTEGLLVLLPSQPPFTASYAGSSMWPLLLQPGWHEPYRTPEGDEATDPSPGSPESPLPHTWVTPEPGVGSSPYDQKTTGMG